MSRVAETIEINFSRAIPVFPLPGCVLLPHGSLPLHVFEPRYLRMIGDVIDSSGLLAMGLFRKKLTQEEYLHGRPAIRSHVCVGYVEQYKPLEDGRYLLLLRGLCRAQVIDEEPHEPYRLFHLRPTDLEATDDPSLKGQRRRIESLLNDPSLRGVEGVEELIGLLDKRVPTTALIDIVAMQLCDDAEQRYPLLAESRAQRRGDALTEQLLRLRDRIGSVGSRNPTVGFSSMRTLTPTVAILTMAAPT